MKKCPACGKDNEDNDMLCQECGYRFDGQSDAGKGSFLGDNNMVSGDVVGGNLDRRAYYGNVTTNNTSNTSNVVTNNTNTTTNNNTTTNVYYQDESKKIVQCEVCNRKRPIIETFECPGCHRMACLDCRDDETGLCRDCALDQAKKRDNEYRAHLEKILDDNAISFEDRSELDKLRKKLGIEKQHARELEAEVRKARNARQRTDRFPEEETETCPKCGAERLEGKKFCTKCGFRFTEEETNTVILAATGDRKLKIINKLS